MGTWGTGIKSNDTSADIYDDFFCLYNEGKSVKEITEQLIHDNKEIINDKYDSNNFWFALALCQWECKLLSDEIFEKVKTIIESKNDLLIWKDTEATDADIKKRETELNKFLIKLQTEKKTAKRIIKKKHYDSIFSKGDCLVYKMVDGTYGGTFVLTDEQNTEVGANFIAITDIHKQEKPTVEDFKKAAVFVRKEKDVNKFLLKYGKVKIIEKDIPQIGMAFAIDFSKEKTDIEVIGRIKLSKEYKRSNSFSVIYWNELCKFIPQSEKTRKSNRNTKIKLSKWIKTQKSVFKFLYPNKNKYQQKEA